MTDSRIVGSVRVDATQRIFRWLCALKAGILWVEGMLGGGLGLTFRQKLSSRSSRGIRRELPYRNSVKICDDHMHFTLPSLLSENH